MKVMCIDSKPAYGFITITDDEPLKEGSIYEVEVEFVGIVSKAPYYGLKGYNWEIGVKGHLRRRFIPLSDIDETEMIRERQKQLA